MKIDYYRDKVLPLYVSQALVNSFGFTHVDAEKRVRKFRKHIQLAYNAHPVPGEHTALVIAAGIRHQR